MFKAPDSPYLVPFNKQFKYTDMPARPAGDIGSKKDLKKQLRQIVEQISDLQRIFSAHDQHAILLVFQGMDAAGKDGVIRNLLSGINPAGCQVFSFKQPTPHELDHDFLWRTSRCLPERGRIGVFNRSYYEEVLVVKVHPDYLRYQRLPEELITESVWQQRYESIRDHELHLARNGTVVLKFWLNVSWQEQRRRFLSRLDEPEKHWKFSSGDIQERGYWKEYMAAFEDALRETSREWAPWYAIPADNKAYARVCVAQIVLAAMQSLKLRYPQVDEEVKQRFADIRQALLDEKTNEKDG